MIIVLIRLTTIIIDLTLKFKTLALFYERKPGIKSYTYLLALTLSTVVIYGLLLIPSFTLIRTAGWIAVTVISIRYFLIGPFARKFTTAIYMLSLFICIELVAGAVSLSLSQGNLYYEGKPMPTVNFYVGAAINIALRLFAYILLRIYVKSTTKSVAKKERSLFFLPIISCLLFYSVMRFLPAQVENYSSHYMLIFIIVLFISCILNIGTHDIIFHRMEIEKNTQALELQKNYSEQLYRVQSERMQEHSKLLHDIKGHLQTIERMRMMDSAGTAVYIQDLLHSLDGPPAYQVNNDALSAILYIKQMECQEKSIELKMDIAYDDLSFLSYRDTCTLFENLFNNAKEACLEIPEGALRYILLKIRLHNQMLSIVMQNGYNGIINEYKGSFLSTKAEGRGTGLKNIERTVEQYRGSSEIICTGDSFTYSILFPIP